MTGEFPYANIPVFEIPENVINGRRLPIPKEVSSFPRLLSLFFKGNIDYLELMCRAWTQEAEKRPTMEELVNALSVLLQKLDTEVYNVE